MNQLKRFGLTAALCLCMASSSAAVFENTAIVAEAHSGRTDSSGGHRDKKNASGLGGYHYHCGGYPAHLHENGKCPYSQGWTSGTSGNSSSGGAEESREQSAASQEMMEAYKEVFDAGYYYNAYEDLQSSVGDDDLKLFAHFITSGMAEGRVGCADFNVNVYRENNADLNALFGDDLPRYYHHYMESGCHEGRICK